MAIKAILFDLDGTLLPMDTDAFVRQYLKSLAPYVANVIPPETMVASLWKATELMIFNKEAHRTNEEVFVEEFCKLTGVEKEQVWPTFDQFYEEEFPKLHIHTQPNPEQSRKVIQAALNQGYRVAIATNPVFPRAAICQRLQWAGVDDLPIDFVTVYEETRFCKPHPEYYLEVVERLGFQPDECVMVGNDRQEDLVASLAGLKTYYINQCRIDRGEPAFVPDQEGTMDELYQAITQKEGIFAS